MPEKKEIQELFFSGRFFFADQPTRLFDRPATRNKLFPKVALSNLISICVVQYVLVLYILKWQTRHNNTTLFMKQINLQVTGVLDDSTYFGPRVLPRMYLVIALVCPWSVRWSVFKYLRDRSLVFPNFVHEVRAPQGYKSDRARFLGKES